MVNNFSGTNTNTDIGTLKTLLSAFQNIENQSAKQSVSIVEELLNTFKKKEVEWAALRRSETPYYDILKVLRIQRKEVILHTRFLAHLLNPEESHEQGNFFLKDFLEIVLGLPAIERSEIEILVERRNKWGQIDIQILWQEEGIRKVAVIENKIGADDQEKQLWRYYQYLEDCGMSVVDISMVYLTINGEAPSQQSLGKTPTHCLKCLSYRKDIFFWLTNAIATIEHNALYFTIVQYLKTIATL